MARKYLAFDIETAKDVPGPDFNWKPHRPLGIACAAAIPCDSHEPTIWYGTNATGTPAARMSRDDCQNVVSHLARMVSEGYTLLTWNGLGFDFDVLSEESGAFDECKHLAMNHVDMMFHVFCDRGFPVALDKAAQALGISGKPVGMSGMLAPQLWAQGRHQEVIDYVVQDVRLPLQVAQICEQSRSFKWMTRSGTVSSFDLKTGWLAVSDALLLPEPDTSWMDAPIPRQQFTQWLNSPAGAASPPTSGTDILTGTTSSSPPSARDFFNKVLATLEQFGTVTNAGTMEIQYDPTSVTDAKRLKTNATQLQKVLRLIKKEITFNKKRVTDEMSGLYDVVIDKIQMLLLQGDQTKLNSKCISSRSWTSRQKTISGLASNDDAR